MANRLNFFPRTLAGRVFQDIFHRVLQLEHVQKMVIDSSAPRVCFCCHAMSVLPHVLHRIKLPSADLFTFSYFSRSMFSTASDRWFSCSLIFSSSVPRAISSSVTRGRSFGLYLVSSVGLHFTLKHIRFACSMYKLLSEYWIAHTLFSSSNAVEYGILSNS